MKLLTSTTLALILLASCGKPPADSETNIEDVIDQPEAPITERICTDSWLTVDLSMPALPGTSGKICLYTAEGKLVDTIDMADMATVNLREDGFMVPKEQVNDNSTFNTFMDVLGVPGKGHYRVVHYTPFRIDGNKVSIKPHSNVLEFDKEYYLTIEEGTFQGYKGLAVGDMRFWTSKAPASNGPVTVDTRGKANFCTIQGAIDYVSKYRSAGATTIQVAAGEYREMLYLRDRAELSIIGEGRNGVIVTYANNESYELGSGSSTAVMPMQGKSIGKSGGRGVILVENCDNLRLENMTLENCFGQEKGQAEVIYFNSGSNGHHLIIENCTLSSLQDTFLCKGICYVHKSLIEGHCDYIWGYPELCLFEDCEIRSLAKGYIVQARVPSKDYKGFIFLNCKLTSKQGLADDSVWLARSAGQADCWDNVIFVNCSMCPAIRKAGWCTDNSRLPNPQTASVVAGWREYGSTDDNGNATSEGRNRYGKVLSDSEAEPYLSKEKIMN